VENRCPILNPLLWAKPREAAAAQRLLELTAALNNRELISEPHRIEGRKMNGVSNLEWKPIIIRVFPKLANSSNNLRRGRARVGGMSGAPHTDIHVGPRSRGALRNVPLFFQPIAPFAHLAMSPQKRPNSGPVELIKQCQ